MRGLLLLLLIIDKVRNTMCRLFRSHEIDIPRFRGGGVRTIFVGDRSFPCPLNFEFSYVRYRRASRVHYLHKKEELERVV